MGFLSPDIFGLVVFIPNIRQYMAILTSVCCCGVPRFGMSPLGACPKKINNHQNAEWVERMRELKVSTISVKELQRDF